MKKINLFNTIMLSICIPIYNFDVNPLVSALDIQLKKLDSQVKLILIDDSSDIEYKKLNESICSNFQYIKLEQNIGRSSIRNLFLKYTKSDYLLFLDCDSLIVDDLFIEKYIEEIKKGEEGVICGGRVYQQTSPGKNKLLRWKYGLIKESQTAAIRNIAPNHSFMTNNFVVKKEILQNIQFDERLKNYGHEDTLFGFELLKAGIQIKHIENPVDNGDIEDNNVFLEKTEKGIQSLVAILKYMNYDTELIKMIKLARVMMKIQSMKMLWLISLTFFFLKPLLKYTLINGPISLWAFDFYKLGLLIQNTKKV